MKTLPKITVALDGTGGDNLSAANVVSAVSFATTIDPELHLMVFGSAELEQALAKAGLLKSRCQFSLAPQRIPQDELPRKVLEGYSRSAMRLALNALKDGEADAVLSSGGTGPLVTLSRHLLGVIDSIRPALCAKIPGGDNRFSLMLDLGANSSSTPDDLHDFAKLGSAAYKILFGANEPTVSVLNVGSERDKGNALVKEARDLISSDNLLCCQGFIEANKIFTGNADVIVTDGFTGNVALKAAEGVAGIFAGVGGIKKFFAKLARPDWLLPWQYNGSLLLGVNGVVIKSHASAGSEALAVALVEAAKNARLKTALAVSEELKNWQ